MSRFNSNNSSRSSETLASSRRSSLVPYHQELYGPPSQLQLLSPSPSPQILAYDAIRPYSPILPMSPSPSRPLTTAFIPRDCFVESVPHPPYKNMGPDQTGIWQAPIYFAPIDVPENRGIIGTPMRDCLYGFGLKEPEELLFQNLASAGKSHIELVIMWPGYPRLDWNAPISIYGSDSFLVTKREFAHRVAIQYQNFALMCELTQLWCQDPRWRVGSGGYTFDRMRLSEVVGIDEDVWQARIQVLTDRDVDPRGLKPMRDISPR